MTAQPHGLSPSEFIAWELRQPAKHEYSAGQVSAFAGGTKRHALIAAEILAALLAHLRGGPCFAFGSDVAIATARSVRYADIVVSCDERDTRELGDTTLRAPKLIVEVLSESTAATDRGDKLDEYRTLESLEEYVLVDSRKRWVETYRRVAGDWIVSLPLTDGIVRFASVDISIAFDALYANADVAAPTTEE